MILLEQNFKISDSPIVSHKIDYAAYGLHIDSPAWELK